MAVRTMKGILQRRHTEEGEPNHSLSGEGHGRGKILDCSLNGLHGVWGAECYHSGCRNREISDCRKSTSAVSPGYISASEMQVTQSEKSDEVISHGWSKTTQLGRRGGPLLLSRQREVVTMHAGNGQLHQNDKSRQLSAQAYLAAKKCREPKVHALYDRYSGPMYLWRAWQEDEANGGVLASMA